MATRTQPKVVALCKTFGGTEFVEAAIEALYDFVDRFVFVNSTRNWLGEPGVNTVLPVINTWAMAHDQKGKIIPINGDWAAQREQYEVGYEFITKNLKCDWVLMFDTDEVWDYSNLDVAAREMRQSPEYNALGAYMHTYIKSPFYRVTPPEMCKPTVLIRPIFQRVIGIRGNGVRPRKVPDNLFFHHFTYVRYREADVMKKVQTTLMGDREDVPSCALVDMERWKEKKWDKLPKAMNFHTTKGFEPSWHKIRVVSERELPSTVRDKRILKEYNQ